MLFALHFGRVGREHGRYKAGGQGVGDGLGGDAGPAQAGQRDFNAAFLRVAGAFVDGAAADVVPVFGQIGQVAEVGERANHAHGLITAQPLKQLLQRLVGLVVGVAPESHRQLADLLDQLKRRHPFLLADDIAQNPAQQPDVLHQRAFVVFGAQGQCRFGSLDHGVLKKRLLTLAASAMLAFPAIYRLPTGYGL